MLLTTQLMASFGLVHANSRTDTDYPSSLETKQKKVGKDSLLSNTFVSAIHLKTPTSVFRETELKVTQIWHLESRAATLNVPHIFNLTHSKYSC